MSHLDDSTNETDSSGMFSVDDEDQLAVDDTLLDRGVDDPLDEGYSPPERPLGVDRFGTTSAEERQRESLEQRVAQEEPDPTTAADPLDGSGSVEGDDDPDSTFAQDEGFTDDREVGGRRAGRLVDPDQGFGEDAEPDLVGRDVGIDGAAASAEEAAMHIIEDSR